MPGGKLTYSGTVLNTGDVSLKNIVVVSDRPAPNTTVFTLALLAPGASRDFTSQIAVPASGCSVATTFSGQGQDNAPPTSSRTPFQPLARSPPLRPSL